MPRLEELLRSGLDQGAMPIAMRKAILMLLLALASSGAMAEWVEVASRKTHTIYVDPTTIRGTDNQVRMWVLNNHMLTQWLDNRESFKSEKAEYEYDCKLAQSRLLYFTLHTESMAGGEVVDFNVVPSQWMRISAGSGLEFLWKIACGKV